MKLTRSKLFLSAVVVLLAGAGFVHAQETTSGSISGLVLDAQGAAMPGVTVTITSPQGSKSYVTDSGGRYYAPFLTPGTYGVRVELSGFSPAERKGIEVVLGQRYSVDFTLKVGPVTETIEVAGTAPVVNVTSTTSGGIIESVELKHLPVGRNLADTLYIVPGVSDSSGVGRANPSMAGASGLDNNYIIDGVNMSNTGYGGLGNYSIIFGSLGVAVTSDFIKETQVKTSGFEAEYGLSNGGVVNVITQSGSNELHGAVFGYFAPPALQASFKQLNSPNGTVNTTGTRDYDFGVSLGLPLVKDKLFVFGTFDPQYERRTFIAPQNFPLRSIGDQNRDRRSLGYAGKLTWQLNSNHKIDVSAFGDPSKGDPGPQRFTALRAKSLTQYSSLNYANYSETLRYDGILSANWLIEGSVGRAQNHSTEIPQIDQWAITNATVTPIGHTGGIGFYQKGGFGRNDQYKFASTNIFEAGGQHQIRYGVQYEDVQFELIRGRTGPTFTLPNGVVTSTGASLTILPDPVYGKIYRVTRANFGPPPLTTQKFLNLFLQDTWQIGKRLTVKPGVRWEREHLVGGTPLCHANDSDPGAADGTGPTMNCSVVWSNNWSPRIGATYDVLGNGKSKIFANFGRFFVRVPNDLAARIISADSGVQRADYFDAGLTKPVPAGTLAAGATVHFQTQGAFTEPVIKGTKLTYTDEFAAGVEFEVARNLNFGVRYIHRTIPRLMEDAQNAAVVAFDIGCPGTDAGVNTVVENVSASLPRYTDCHIPSVDAASQEDPTHKYDTIEVTLNKRFSDNWSMLASYRWARLKGNFEGFYRSDNGQSDPAITSLFDFPTNDASYTQIGGPQFGYTGDIRYQGTSLGTGVLPNDRPHQFKIYTSYAIQSLNLGLGLNAGSGRALTALAANPNYDNGGEIPTTLRGGGIQTINGFLTRTNFEFVVDLSADYTVKLSNKVRMILGASAFNLFNNQNALDYDAWIDSGFQTPNPNFGQPANGGNSAAASYRRPLTVRLGARLEW